MNERMKKIIKSLLEEDGCMVIGTILSSPDGEDQVRLTDEELASIPSRYKTTVEEIKAFAKARQEALNAFDAEFIQKS